MDDIREIEPGSPEWPDMLDDLLDPPARLYVAGAGNLAKLTRRSVAVVGSRAATAYGEHCARQLALDLARRGITVTSGLASGIDAAAHRGALAGQGPTIAVLGGGVDRPYPPGNATLYHQILRSGGLVLSEYEPGSPPRRWTYTERNRIIGALSAGLVVAEAARTGGSMQAAAKARETGRPVMAMPGPTTSAMSTGCHVLIRQGATLVAGIEDVLGTVSFESECEGHPAGEFDPLGETLYCDGACRR